MKKSDVINAIFKTEYLEKPQRDNGFAFAPTNIALCKYWGKRDAELNLPMTSSLSIALPGKGATTTLTPREKNDLVVLNGKTLAADTPFVVRLRQFLDLFRPNQQWHLNVDIDVNIPIAAGLASSACGFASTVLALDDLFEWQLSPSHLSILARLGSGSASRSFWNGFVEWHAGISSEGMDSYAEPLSDEWPDLRVGILSIAKKEKAISSREAMQRTIASSMLYSQWPQKVARDLQTIHVALKNKQFSLLGSTAESNALTMHATMLSSWPPICYSLPETIAAMQQIWALRSEGLDIYFTQDAGPNLKLLFLAENANPVMQYFPEIEIVTLF